MKRIRIYAAKIIAVMLAAAVCFASTAVTAAAATEPYLFYLVYSDIQANKTSADQRYGANSNHINSQQLPTSDTARGISGSSIVYLAKNEREGFQVYFHEQTASRPLRVEVGEFCNAAGEVLPVSIYNEAYFRPWTGGEQLGEALVPYDGEVVNTVLNENNMFYVELRSAEDQTPGNYTSTVTLYDGDAVLAQKSVTAVVWNFALPESHYATALMGLYNSASGYGATQGFLELNGVRIGSNWDILEEDIPLAESIVEGWQECLLDHGITPYELPRFLIDSDEKAAELAMADPRRKMVSVPISGNITSQATTNKILQYKALVDGNSVLEDKAFFYPADEPSWGADSDTSSFESRIQAINALWPDSHKMVPFASNFDTVMPVLKKTTDVLCINQSALYTEKNINAFNEYTSGDGWHRKLRYHGDITLGSFELWRWGKSPAGVFRRIFFWQSGLLGDNGMLYWNCGYIPYVNGEPYNVWETNTLPSASGVQTGNGNGVLLYPGAPIGEDPTQPIMSLRLKQVSAGLDDYDYIALAREFLGKDSQVLDSALKKVFVNYEKHGLNNIFSSEPHEGISVDWIAWECNTMNNARKMLGDALDKAAAQHNYGEWQLVVEPDAQHDGLEIRTCTDCGTQDSRDVPRCSLGAHDYAYTDNGDGTHTRICTVCGTEDVQAHNEEVVPGKAATCTAEGLTDGRRCTECGAVTKAQAVLEKLPHTPGEWVYTSDGIYEKECTVCHNVIDRQTVELTLEPAEITLTNGETAQLNAGAADFTKIIYASANSAVAAVDANGRITAKAPGETVITVSVEGTDLAKTCKVTVAPRLYTVTWVIDGVSQITEVAEGAALTPPAVHDRPGYNFAGWSPALPDVMPSADVTFTAVFEPVIRVSVVPAGASDEQVGQVIYHKVPWYKTWTSQTVDLTVASDDDSQIARVEWVYANWSVDEPEATIENAYSRTATIRPTWGIGARSCWVQAVVTDVYGNKIYSEPVKVRFYNWDWQK